MLLDTDVILWLLQRENLLGIQDKLYYECIKFYRSNVLKNYYKRGLIVRLFIIPVIQDMYSSNEIAGNNSTFILLYIHVPSTVLIHKLPY